MSCLARVSRCLDFPTTRERSSRPPPVIHRSAGVLRSGASEVKRSSVLLFLFSPTGVRASPAERDTRLDENQKLIRRLGSSHHAAVLPSTRVLLVFPGVSSRGGRADTPLSPWAYTRLAAPLTGERATVVASASMLSLSNCCLLHYTVLK